MKIGVLALQGDFAEHLNILSRLGADAVTVRLPDDLNELDGLIIPGGESTTIARLLHRWGLIEPIRTQVHSGMAVWGTCAGAILLAGLALATPPRAAVPDPDPQSLLDRGRLRLRLGEPDRAIEALLAAVRAAPDSAPARLWLGRALLAKGDAANAQRQLAFAIELAPDDAEAYVAMARAHRDQGRIEASEAVGRRLLGRGHPRGHWIMARALRAGGRDAEALAAFDAYLAAATPSEAERQAVAGYRKLVAERRSGGEGRDLLDWVDNPDLSAAHRRAHDAFVAIANISESQRQGT